MRSKICQVVIFPGSAKSIRNYFIALPIKRNRSLNLWVLNGSSEAFPKVFLGPQKSLFQEMPVPLKNVFKKPFFLANRIKNLPK